MGRLIGVLPFFVLFVVEACAQTAPSISYTISTLAGNRTSGFGGDGGAATAARLSSPHGVATDAQGSIYIADTDNNRIRRVSPDGRISTVAGDGTAESGGRGDGGPAIAASLSSPEGVFVDRQGNLYIADTSNNRVRKVTPDGKIVTIAGIPGSGGFSGDGGPATAARLSRPNCLTMDAQGVLYIVDSHNHRVRKVTPDGKISTVAGNGSSGFGGDGGPATAASLSMPSGVAIDKQGAIYIGDTYNNRVLKVTPDGRITTVAGSGASGYSGDVGPATAARLSWPCGVAIDQEGNLFIVDSFNNRVRKVGLDGRISTIAGGGSNNLSTEGSPALSASLLIPEGIALDEQNNIYIADSYTHRIRKLTPLTCTYSLTLAGAAFPASGGTGTANITAPGGCPWAASSDSPAWLSITSATTGLGSASVAFAVTQNRTASARTGRLTIAGQIYTVTQAGANLTISTVSAASWQGPNVARNMLVTSMGANLATATASAAATPWPTTLAGVTITLTDSAGKSGPASLYFGSPNQVNWLVPDWPAAGAAKVTLKSSDGTEFTSVLQVGPVAPGLFSANSTGSGLAAAAAVLLDASDRQSPVPVLQCGTLAGSCAAMHLDPLAGDLIVLLFGTGIRGFSTISAHSNGQTLEVVSAAAQGVYAGLDQVNVRIPKSLAGAGEIPLVIHADDQPSNQVLIAVGPAPARISSVQPSTLARGQRTRLTVTGERLSSATGFTVFPATGFTIAGVTASESTLSADVTVAADAALGDYLIAAATGAGRSDAMLLRIVGGMPRITSLSPATMKPGQTVTMAISGDYFDGATALSFSPAEGITVSSLVATATRITATVAVAATAALGQRTLTVTAPQGVSNATPFLLSDQVSFDGEWKGTTSQGQTVSFTVSNNTVTGYKIGVNLPFSGYSCPSGMTQSGGLSLPIINNQFSGMLSGSFDSPTTAKGSYNWSVSIPQQGCYASGIVQWTAVKP